MSADDIREADRHASWREVCHALGVDPDQHEQSRNQGEDSEEYV